VNVSPTDNSVFGALEITPRVRSVKVVSPRDRRMQWTERIYIVALFKGLMVTMRHFLVQIRRKDKFTLEYPEQKRHFRPNYRGSHRLTVDDEGRPKCVACEMCSTACPAECIHIEAAPAPWPDRERYPAVFQIDLLRCIYCGFCVEACPEEAIVMTTNIDIVSYARRDLLWDRERLLANR
jgi:NADH-quinone oxidoreductase subunit I